MDGAIVYVRKGGVKIFFDKKLLKFIANLYNYGIHYVKSLRIFSSKERGRKVSICLFLLEVGIGLLCFSTFAVGILG
jgi:hypothetical protein